MHAAVDVCARSLGNGALLAWVRGRVGALADMVSGRPGVEWRHRQAALPESGPTYRVPSVLLVSEGGDFDKNVCQFLQNHCPELCGEMSVWV